MVEKHCKVCGRKIVSNSSVNKNIGPVCYKRLCNPSYAPGKLNKNKFFEYMKQFYIFKVGNGSEEVSGTDKGVTAEENVSSTIGTS